MATWNAYDVFRIGPPGNTITVEFTLDAHFTGAVDGLDLTHKLRYQLSVTGADPAAKRADLIAQVEAKTTGLLARVRQAAMTEIDKANTTAKAMAITITDRNAGSVA